MVEQKQTGQVGKNQKVMNGGLTSGNSWRALNKKFSLG